MEHEYPLGTSLGQTRHQTSVTNKGNYIDHDVETMPAVIDENGVAVLSDDEIRIKELVRDAISLDNLVETFNVNSHDTLLKLLALQDNKHPLKKGGVGISYRTDALIMHCKMEFTNDENIVFDAILGMMSSLPENKTYRLEPKSFQKFSKGSDDKYLYRVFKKGTESLQKRHLIFSGLGADGNDEIVIPWFNILRYHKSNSRGQEAFIEFTPTDFFKDLALCSQIVHGAYGALEVIMQLRGKYTIALYWFLENKKRYKEFPNSKSGFFEISIEEFRYQFSIPESYPKAEIDRRVLMPAMKSINSIKECDFKFTYKAVKEKGQLLGYRFEITEKKQITKKDEPLLIEDSALKQQIIIFCDASNLLFSEQDIDSIYRQAVKYNKDTISIMQVLLAFKERLDDNRLEGIDDPVGYLCKMIAVDKSSTPIKNQQKNQFNKFTQNDYDFAELEDKLLDN